MWSRSALASRVREGVAGAAGSLCRAGSCRRRPKPAVAHRRIRVSDRELEQRHSRTSTLHSSTSVDARTQPRCCRGRPKIEVTMSSARIAPSVRRRSAVRNLARRTRANRAGPWVPRTGSPHRTAGSRGPGRRAGPVGARGWTPRHVAEVSPACGAGPAQPWPWVAALQQDEDLDLFGLVGTSLQHQSAHDVTKIR